MDVLASNALADALLSPLADPRAMVRSLFFDPAARELFADWLTVAGDTVAALRLASGHEPLDVGTTALLSELLEESEEFTALWGSHDVGRLGSKTKTFHHPVAGRFTLTYQTFEVQDPPGSRCWSARPSPAAVTPRPWRACALHTP